MLLFLFIDYVTIKKKILVKVYDQADQPLYVIDSYLIFL